MTLQESSALALARLSLEDLAGIDQGTRLNDLINSMKERLYAINAEPVTSEEERSWRDSLMVLSTVLTPLHQAGGALDLLLEFRLPGESRRIDAVFVGRGSSGEPCILVVELKGWNEKLAPLNEEQRKLRTVFVHGMERSHPVPQVLDYQHDLKRFNSFVRPNKIGVECAVFMPRMAYPLPELDGQRLEQLFLAHDHQRFREFVAETVGQGRAENVAEQLNHSHTVQPLDMQQRLLGAFQGRDAYELTDDQRGVAHRIWRVIKEVRNLERPSMIWVEGGPGTGKTAIALQLLALMLQEQQQAQASQPQPERDLIRLALPTPLVTQILLAGLCTDDLKDARRLIAHPNDLKQANIDLLVCDEAHRVKNSALERLICCGQTVVLLYDEGQIVRPDEGTLLLEWRRNPARWREQYPNWAIRATEPLTQQMRCRSETYVEWVNALLQGTPPPTQILDYDFNIVNDIHDLEDHVRGESDRMVAGFCWEWNKKDDDIRIHGWTAPWNPEASKPLDPADHEQVRWVQNINYRRHVGSIYTAQGLEFPKVAVIWGGDLVWRKDRWVAQLSARRGENPLLGNVDPVFHAFRRAGNPEAALPYLLNIYRVLLTRGKEATTVYFTDEETREHVRGLLP